VSYEALSSMSNDGDGDGWRRRRPLEYNMKFLFILVIN